MQGISPKKQSVRLQSVKQPSNVKVIILSENRTSLKEFYLIKTYSNLIKIDLSYNKLSSFPHGFSFGSFNKLRTLFLHYNRFLALKVLGPVVEAKTVQYLTLFGNPLEEPKARHLFVNQIPSLMLMDDKVVKLQQRHMDLTVNESFSKVLSFPLLGGEQSEDTQLFLQNVMKELSIVRKCFLQVNPLVKIQRWWKGICNRRYRKWKIVTLPKEEKDNQHGFRQHREELDRLVTQKMEMCRTQQEIALAVLQGNWKFWTSLAQIISQKDIYLSREYCQLNKIQFDQIGQFRVLRHFGEIQIEKIKCKRQLNFFIAYHQRIIVLNCSKVQKKEQKKEGLKVKSRGRGLLKKYEVNGEKSLKVEQKLNLLDVKYQFYVKPKLDKNQLLKITKKQYYKYIKHSLLQTATDSYPILSFKLVQRTKAATTIQRFWHGIILRRKLNAKIWIKQQNAARTIQFWVRGLKFRHRYNFLLQVSEYLKKEKQSNEIILQMSQIPAIQEYCSYKQNVGALFVVPFQNCKFSFRTKAGMGLSEYGQSSRHALMVQAERKPNPQYLKLSLQTVADVKMMERYEKSNVLELLFKYVKDIEKIVDCTGTKYIKFVFGSVEQTLNRKFVLALKTYRMHNHQFIRSMQCPKVPQQYISNIIKTINQNRLVNVIYDNNSHLPEGSIQQSVRILESKKSVSSLVSDMSMLGDTLCIKIRFYIVSNDYSCMLMIKSPGYGGKEVKSNLEQCKDKYFLNRKRWGPSRWDQGAVDNASKISRHIMSLNQLDQDELSQRKKSQRYQKILNTDQSHSFLDSLNPLPRKESIQRLHSHRMQSYDKFDKEVYPSATEVVRDSLKSKRYIQDQKDLIQKKHLISQIRSSHRQKLNELVIKKSEYLNHVKDMVSKQHSENEKLIGKLREQLQRQKSMKRDKIRQRFKNSSQRFQEQFFKKGIRSIRKTQKELQKKSQSFRDYKYVAEQKIEKPKKLMKEAERKKGYQVQKTEIKEFSINFSQADLSMRMQSGREVPRYDNQKSSKEKSYHRMMSYNEKFKSMTSQISESNPNMKSEIVSPDEVDMSEERKKMRKKRIVHSVFPQEFYPLKQSHQIGFELPKIKKQ